MTQQLINSMIEWERRLEFEEEKRKNYQPDWYVSYLAALQSRQKERKSIFARVFQIATKARRLPAMLKP